MGVIAFSDKIDILSGSNSLIPMTTDNSEIRRAI